MPILSFEWEQIGRNDGSDQLGIKINVNLNVFNVIEMGDLLDNNFKSFPTEGGRFKHIWANQKQLELLTGEREVNEVGFVLEHDNATLCRTCYTTAHLSPSIGINNLTVYTCSSSAHISHIMCNRLYAMVTF